MQALVVDDDAGIRETLTQILRDEGYSVAEAANGAEAIEAMRASTEPLLVLLDFWMPGVNGEKALLTALEQTSIWSHLGVIMMTANPQLISPHVREVLTAHGIPLLLKPFDVDPLVNLIEQRMKPFSDAPRVERARTSGSLS